MTTKIELRKITPAAWATIRRNRKTYGGMSDADALRLYYRKGRKSDASRRALVR